MLKRILLVVLLGLPCAAEPTAVSPPEGARVVGTLPSIRLSWQGSASEYYLQVLAAGRSYYDGPVTGNSFVMRLVPNLYYTWNVCPVSAGLRGASETHHFQYSPENRYVFDGAPGTPGRRRPGQPGGAGGPGQNGDGVNIYLAPVGDLVSVRLEGSKAKVAFLLLPDSAPVSVSVQGGIGGTGASGDDGVASYLSSTGFVVSSSGGQMGGPGGAGGAGGQVWIHNSLPPGSPQRLQVNVEGGAGGQGGPGGRPGGVGIYGGQGAVPGQDGPRGPDGPRGTVTEVPR